jgi:hypothetical protein
MDINAMSDYERGEYDCLIGNAAKLNDSPEYYSGYGDRYCVEQNQAARIMQAARGQQ